ncbi:MAG TPA: glycoside hydrolase family 2 TIM barrel-domain containing protein, partial [Bryocella sp.]|nr:glycoside hydrolase family 2 TIM barrel-domain containing protein [Bryocella sp.]
GQVLKLRGVGDHLYGGPMGAAIPDGILERRLRLLKEMGVNAIRTSHNPHTPYFYDLCDRLGILVMDEIYDGWHKKVQNEYAQRFYASQWHHDVERWVRRDRNHPSVFIWSIGNETGLVDVNHMTEYVHTFDPTRPTTGGMITTGVDVSGWNGPGEVPGVLEKFHAEHPTVPIVLTEEPHTLQTRGFYRVRTWWRDWKPVQQFEPYGTEEIFFDGNPWYNSSYDNAIVRDTARQSWKRTSSTPWIAGEFRWLGFDYIGEAAYKGGHWPVRAENFGIIDLAAIPKDDYFLYKAFWTKRPMVHLLPHWTHRNMEGVVIPVVAYSNQPQVELFLNGKSLGRKRPQPLGDFLWDVPYEPGTLKAIAYGQGGEQVATAEFETAGDPTGLKLETDNSALKPNRTDDAVITVTIVDKDGTMVPWDMNTVHFKLTGPVHLLGNENGDPVDVTPNQAPYRNAFYGMARGFYQATAQDAPIEIAAAAILGDTAIAGTSPQHPRMVSIAVSRMSLRGVLANADLVIRYTTDGSEPNAQSSVFSGPFGVSDDTQVKAVVFRDGSRWMQLSQWFHRVDPPVVSDPRWATDSTVDPLAPRKRGGERNQNP